MRLTLEALTPDKLNVFRDLLGSSEFGGCFCAVWTSYGDDWVERCHDKSQPNFYITKRNVEAGQHTGFLVYQKNDLIGWTGSGPKTSFPFLKTKLGSRLSEFSSKTWSVGCLAVKAAYRGKGMADADLQDDELDTVKLVGRAEKIQQMIQERDPVALKNAYKALFSEIVVGEWDKNGRRELRFRIRGSEGFEDAVIGGTKSGIDLKLAQAEESL